MCHTVTQGKSNAEKNVNQEVVRCDNDKVDNQVFSSKPCDSLGLLVQICIPSMGGLFLQMDICDFRNKQALFFGDPL